MEFVRQIVHSSLLDKISLPKSLENRKVEVIILPVSEEVSIATGEQTIDAIVGILEKYKNPDLISLEKEAWGRAVMDKHGIN